MHSILKLGNNLHSSNVNGESEEPYEETGEISEGRMGMVGAAW